MILSRMMWKDWGFEPAIHQQAKRFAELAHNDEEQEAHIRASIIFSLLCVEAHYNAIVRSYMQDHRSTIPAAKLKKVESSLRARSGITNALETWPALLTGTSLDRKSATYTTYTQFREYRNALIHADITRPLRTAGELAQEMETVENADLAFETTAEMIRMISLHFGYDVPAWV